MRAVAPEAPWETVSRESSECIGNFNDPFGPVTVKLAASAAILTPAGTETGTLPRRDMSYLCETWILDGESMTREMVSRKGNLEFEK